MKSPNMTDWYDAFDQVLQLPIQFDEKSAVVDPIPPGGGIINLAAKLDLDEQHRPVIAYHKYGPAGNLQFYVASSDDNSWSHKQVTDWDYRWEFNGRGSIQNEVRLENFLRRDDGKYELSYWHIKHGKGTILLSNSFENLGLINKQVSFEESLSVEGSFPGLEKRRVRDGNFVMAWESLPSNRDKPREKPWPSPSLLVLHDLEASNKTKKNISGWQQFNVSDIVQKYPERITFLLNRIDLSRPRLANVWVAKEKGNLLQASQSLLSYYRDIGSKSSWHKDPPPETSTRTALADSILAGHIQVQGVSGMPERDTLDRLQWDYKGPRNDQEYAWGFNRHYHLRDLMNAYRTTGNRAYVKTIDQHVRDWILQSAPYPGIKSRTAMWRGLEASFRVKLWARIFYELIDHPDLQPSTLLLMLTSLPDHAHYAREFHAQGNWLTMELSGLATVAAAWPEFKQSSSWLTYSKRAMEASLEEQVYPDGVQTELTSHYHYTALNNFEQFKTICENANDEVSAGYKKRIEDMWNYLAYSMRPDGYGLLNNDSDLDYNRARIHQAAATYARADWEYISSNGKSGIEPAITSLFYPWAGQLIMRSGYDTDAEWGFFDVGPWGSGHQHSDKLHFSASAFGQDFLVDAGRFAYVGEIADKFRGYARSSAAHNTLTIDGKLQSPGPLVSEFALPISSHHIDSSLSYATGTISNHTRAVCHLPNQCWVVVDCVDSDRSQEVETLWHWHPECEVEEEDGMIVGRRSQGALYVQPIDSFSKEIQFISAQETPEIQGWYSERYNQVEANVAAVSTATISEGSSVFIWILEATTGSEKKVRAKLVGQDEDGISLEIVDKLGARHTLFIPLRDSNLLRHIHH